VLVLVVDDDPAIRRALERALSAEGYGVALAEDGEQALERRTRARPRPARPWVARHRRRENRRAIAR